jgi:UDP-N-acetylmuramoylalanine--D-glutamate ligase
MTAEETSCSAGRTEERRAAGRSIDRYKGQRALVVGIGRSGVGASNLLAALGARVTAVDEKPYEKLKEHVDSLDSAVDIKLGEFDRELFARARLIVLSPGVPPDIEALTYARAGGVEIIGELELAHEALRAKSRRGGCNFLAVTGTNGKTTTTTLLYEMMKTAGFKTVVGGNIGTALTAQALKLIRRYFKSGAVATDYIVTEVSSFQLESVCDFKPKVSAILNLTPDHLDRYHSMNDYVDAKCRVFRRQDPLDFLVLNADDPYTPEVVSRLGKDAPEVYYFSRKGMVRGAYLKDGAICLNLPEHSVLRGLECGSLVMVDELKIRGVHNVENAMAAALMAALSGCPPPAIRRTLIEFPGIEHRIEFVAEIDGATYINDSKGTNTGAVMRSLEGFYNSPVVLIAGGRDKGSDFTALRPYVEGRVKAAVLIGEARHKIAKALEGITSVRIIDGDMYDAVAEARALASPGDVVLLSPSCASFDMFTDYEDRGRVFKRAVLLLAAGVGGVMDGAAQGKADGASNAVVAGGKRS